MTPHKLQISPELAGERLDRALAHLLPECSRTVIQKLIKNGMVEIAGFSGALTPRLTVSSGMQITLSMPDPVADTPSPEPFAFPILYEDADMLVINKPPDVVVHPAAGNMSGTVVNALLDRYPAMKEDLEAFENRPGIVHRLDKDTSGILVIAKHAAAQTRLSEAFAERKTCKTYLALVRGMPDFREKRVETLIGRHPVNRQKMAVVRQNGKEAVSILRPVRSGHLGTLPVTLMEVTILTGRTHQIRVHCAHLGFPVLGDEVYGSSVADAAPRQMLHAWKLSIPQPMSGEERSFCAPPPEDMQILMDQI